MSGAGNALYFKMMDPSVLDLNTSPVQVQQGGTTYARSAQSLLRAFKAASQPHDVKNNCYLPQLYRDVEVCDPT
jgi:hypothetical protein